MVNTAAFAFFYNLETQLKPKWKKKETRKKENRTAKTGKQFIIIIFNKNPIKKWGIGKTAQR